MNDICNQTDSPTCTIPAALTSSFRFCRFSFPALLLISTFRGLETSFCLSITRPFPEDSESKSSVLFSDEPSTGQNMPQNFCRGWLGLELPMFWKNEVASPTADISLSEYCQMDAKACKRPVREQEVALWTLNVSFFHWEVRNSITCEARRFLQILKEC